MDQVEAGSIMRKQGDKKGKSKGSFREKRKDSNSRDKGNQLLEMNGEPDKSEVHLVDDHSEGSKSKKVRRKKRKDHNLSESDQQLTKDDAPYEGAVYHMSLGKPRKARRKKRKEHDFLEDCGQLLQKNEDCGEVYPPSSGNGDTSEMTKSKSKKAKRKKGKPPKLLADIDQVVDKNSEPDPEDVHHISSGDEDGSKGMKKWVMEYYERRPGIETLQQKIDDFITTHEAKLEQERKEREARVAEGGWTVVTHHKGRKKTTDTESGIVVGSVSQAALEDKLAKKKRKEVGSDFYRFQRREAQRNEIMMLQSKFEQDRKRIQQLRAARKFRPY